MKRKIIIGVCLVVPLLAAVAFSQAARKDAAHVHESIVGVDTLMKDPESYRGAIKLEGAVTSSQPNRNLMILIDRKEWHECGKDTCALYKLPVEWTGKLPKVHDEVLVQGEIKEKSGKFVFVASTLEKLPPRPKAAAEGSEQNEESKE